MEKTYIEVIPAYGRDYKNKRQVIADWNDNRDFRIADPFKSGYVNKKDIDAMNASGDGMIEVHAYYDKLRKIAVMP